MRLIDADALPFEPYGEDVISWYATGWNDAINVIDRAPTIDAIPIDTVAEMLAELFGDEIPCNYNDIDEMLSIGCEKSHCPDDSDHSCWKKYVKAWMERKGKDA